MLQILGGLIVKINFNTDHLPEKWKLYKICFVLFISNEICLDFWFWRTYLEIKGSILISEVLFI